MKSATKHIVISLSLIHILPPQEELEPAKMAATPQAS